MNNLKIFALVLLVTSSLAAVSHTTNKLWPKPTNYTYDTEGTELIVNPCSLKITINGTQTLGIQAIVGFYQINIFGCSKTDQTKGELVINVANAGQYIATDLKHQKYTLTLPKEGKWTLKADYYVGFLRAFQTLTQLFNKQTNGTYIVSGLPITISDGPQYLWRGLMIDTSRHFLDLTAIKKLIDGMLYMKLNVLHWHIVDEDSFPMFVPTVPELSQYGNLNGVYSQNDLRSIISYAKTRGIRVVPQIDTPAHTLSWGRSPKYSSITLNCNGKYQGQFDISKDLAWEVISKVLNYANSTFDDNYIHFGGDEVDYPCWDRNPSIQEYMASKGLKDTKELSIYYRQKQKDYFRANISSSKKVIYWANEAMNLPIKSDDILHWWGYQVNQKQLSGSKNPIILSTYDILYLDTGFNSQYGDSYGTYQNWRRTYDFNPVIPNATVLGGTSCMWSETTSKNVLEIKTIQRANILAERLWNTNINIKSDLRNIATRLSAQAERLRARGFKVWPLTVELCEQDMSLCF